MPFVIVVDKMCPLRECTELVCNDGSVTTALKQKREPALTNMQTHHLCIVL